MARREAGGGGADDSSESAKREQIRLLDSASSSREMRVGAGVLAVPRAVARLRHVPSAFAATSEVGLGRRAVRVATITDAYSDAMLAGAFDVVRLHPLVWRRQIERFEPDVLLVESAWTGHRGGWEYEVSHRGRRRPDRLGPLLAHCGRRKIPRVFWNKEDPVGFVRFFAAARDFDLIATTDERAATWYRSMLPGVDVAVAPFPLNPSIHHPVRSHDLSEPGRVVFAGSWSNGDYPDRVRSLDEMLTVASERDALHIYTARPDQFPDRFRPFVQGSLLPDEVWTVSKNYAASINVNSVVGSRTMLSRRVVESLGSGVPVLSSPTPAARNLFGDTVIEVGDRPGMEAALDAVLDPMERSRRSARGWRAAHVEHAVDDRFADLFARVGVDAPDRRADDWSVSVGVSDDGAARAAIRFAGDALAIVAGPGRDHVEHYSGPVPRSGVLARHSRCETGRTSSLLGLDGLPQAPDRP